MATLFRTLICPHCHAEMETTGAFCTECGARLDLDSPSAGPAPVAPAAPLAAPVPSAAPASAPLAAVPTLLAQPAAAPTTPSYASSEPAAPLTAVVPPPAVTVAAAAAVSGGLSADEWRHVITALGHYAGMLKAMHLESEATRVEATYRSALRLSVDTF